MQSKLQSRKLLLTVIDYKKIGNYSFANCQCACGNTKTVRTDTIGKSTFSCGCFRQKSMADKMTGREPANKVHGESGNKKRTAEYRAWAGMKSRCFNKKSQDYRLYGGRGITVCQRWKQSYQNFLEDMGRKPSPDHSLDRINNDRSYGPDNCRWATDKEQAQNKRTYVTLFHLN